MANFLISGLGYRRTGTVTRPRIELTTPLEAELEITSVVTAEIFEVTIIDAGMED